MIWQKTHRVNVHTRWGFHMSQSSKIILHFSDIFPFFFKITYIHAAKACLNHSLNHLLNWRQISSLLPDLKTQHTLFIGENQITIKNQFCNYKHEAVLIHYQCTYSSTKWFPVSTSVNYLCISLKHFEFQIWLLFPRDVHSKLHGRFICPNLIDRHYVPSQSTARNSSLRRWVILSYNRGWIKIRLIAYPLAGKLAQICTVNLHTWLTGIYNWTKWIPVLVSPIIKIKRKEFNHLKEYTANDQFTLP